jgi:hypothetical protein
MVEGTPALYANILGNIAFHFPGRASFIFAGAVILIHGVFTVIPFAALMWVMSGNRTAKDRAS